MPTLIEHCNERGWPFFATKDERVVLINADCLEVATFLPEMNCVAITDPVWPNVPSGLLAGSEDPQSLFRDALDGLDLFARIKTLVVMLGFDSDPRFLRDVPRRLPYVRSMQLPYAVPSYRGRLLGGDEMAYVFGEIPKGRGVIPGRCSTVTDHKADRATGHPCPRADQHLKDLVRWWSVEDDVIVDPFAGTGSTGLAAAAMGRRFIGIEIEPKYFAVAANRIKAELTRAPLFEERPKIVQSTLFT